MTTRNMFFNTAVLFLLLTGTAVAQPRNGFGLNAGLASHSRDCGGCAGSSTSGLSIGMDYQFALSDKLSISPFLMSSGETSSDVAGTSVGHGIFGAQLRYWPGGNMFFGGHLARYSEVLSSGGLSLSGNGGGAGLVAGWEKPDGGLYFMGQLDSATVNYPGLTNIKLTAFRLSGGYRWK